jgi:hypothetical protein
VTRRTVRRALATTFAALALATTAFAQPAADYADETALPAGRRGERIRQLPDAVSSGDPARVEALVKEGFGGPFREIPMEQHLGASSASTTERGVDFYGVRRYTPPGPGPRGRDREEPAHGRVAGLSLTFDGTAEERITGMEICPPGRRKGSRSSRP